MKKISYYFAFLMALVVSSISIAQEQLKISKAQIEYSSDWGEEIDEDHAASTGWTYSEDHEAWLLEEKTIAVSELPLRLILGGVELHIWKTPDSVVKMSVGYEDSDNNSGAETTLHKGVLNNLKGKGNDNSSWYYRADIEVDYQDVATE